MIADTQHPDHFKAVKLGYEQAGLLAVLERNVNVNVTEREKLESIKEWAKDSSGRRSR
jgi:hypothetical protein